MRAVCLLLLCFSQIASAQQPPYDVFPTAEPPYFRVRYEGSDQPGQLAFAVKYTLWIPPKVETLRGLIVHQHGCGEGSCKSGLTGAFDLHWQALAAKHRCALLAPSYEQPQSANCQLWCDPRNGSDEVFQRSLIDLGAACGHPELATVPWALWGHSGGGVWAGSMTLLHPQRVIAAWLRSGVPLLVALKDRPLSQPISIPDQSLEVPIMINLGTKEGVTVTEGRFAGVWPKAKAFFEAMRSKNEPIGVAIDPLTSHECGNQRYLAIPWLDACLSARLPADANQALQPMPADEVWLAPLMGNQAVAVSEYHGNQSLAVWLPNASIAKAWMQYVDDTHVTDATRPPQATNVIVADGVLTWDCEADLESGIGHFIILRDGKQIATVPSKPNHRFGRPIFQGLQYSDTPLQPLIEMKFTDPSPDLDTQHQYEVISVNTDGLRSR